MTQLGWSLVCVAANYRITSRTKEELFVVVKGLALNWNNGHTRVILEVDSMVVTHSLLGEINPSCPYFHVVRRCKEMLERQDWRVVAQHCYREVNRATDWLANYGVGIPPKLVIMEVAPPSLRVVLLKDISGVALLWHVLAVAA